MDGGVGNLSSVAETEHVGHALFVQLARLGEGRKWRS